MGMKVIPGALAKTPVALTETAKVAAAVPVLGGIAYGTDKALEALGAPQPEDDPKYYRRKR